MLRELQQLFIPSLCLLCKRCDYLLCEACIARLSPTENRIAGTPLYVAASDKRMMELVVVWKDERTKQLTQQFAQLLARAIPLGAFGSLTAIPSRKSSRAIRGWQPVVDLAQALSSTTNLNYTQVLFWKNEPVEQRGLDTQSRFNNVSDVFVSLPHARDVWILDDVTTSGATLSSAIRCIESNGGSVAGCLVLAAPRLHHRSQTSHSVLDA